MCPSRQPTDAHDEAVKLCLPLLTTEDFTAVAGRFRRLLAPPAGS